MLKKILVLFTLILAFAFSNANAQYTPEHHYIGPCIGFAFLGNVPQFGLNYEYSMDLQNFGSVGIGGLFRYWGYSDDFFYGKVSYTNILIGVQGNYHFKIPESKFDPYVGLVLADDIGSTSVTYNDAYLHDYSFSGSAGGFWIAIQGGARYWVSPTLAITGRLGLGSLSYYAFEVGVDFKL